MAISEKIKEIVNSKQFEELIKPKFTISIDAEHIDYHEDLSFERTGVDHSEWIEQITKRLDVGDLWAWCTVTVKAESLGFEGFDYLGGCSYKDKADFIECGYYEDMKANAENDLELKFQEYIKNNPQTFDNETGATNDN